MGQLCRGGYQPPACHLTRAPANAADTGRHTGHAFPVKAYCQLEFSWCTLLSCPLMLRGLFERSEIVQRRHGAFASGGQGLRGPAPRKDLRPLTHFRDWVVRVLWVAPAWEVNRLPWHAGHLSCPLELHGLFERSEIVQRRHRAFASGGQSLRGPAPRKDLRPLTHFRDWVVRVLWVAPAWEVNRLPWRGGRRSPHPRRTHAWEPHRPDTQWRCAAQ